MSQNQYENQSELPPVLAQHPFVDVALGADDPAVLHAHPADDPTRKGFDFDDPNYPADHNKVMDATIRKVGEPDPQFHDRAAEQDERVAQKEADSLDITPLKLLAAGVKDNRNRRHTPRSNRSSNPHQSEE